jgi:hypothetical protein
MLSLEPLKKLATFVVAEVINQNVKKKGKKFQKLSPAAVVATTKKGVQKRQHFS